MSSQKPRSNVQAKSLFGMFVWVLILAGLINIYTVSMFLQQSNTVNANHNVVHGNVNDNNNDDDIRASNGSSRSHTANRKILHVLNGIHLKNKEESGIISEWEINLKSVLSNAPTDNDMHIHLIANQDATDIITEKINQIQLVQSSKWKNKISLTIYNIESRINEWRIALNEYLRDQRIDERVSLGGYYRLLAYIVLKDRFVDEVLYMDTDVVILSNLNDVMKYMNTTHEENESMIWQYAESYANSGFMVLNMRKFHKFWELIAQLPDIKGTNDQALLSQVAEHWPNSNYNGVLPDEWNTHLGHGWRSSPDKLIKSVENDGRKVGMVHFTGGFGETYFSGTNGLDKYCERTSRCKNRKQGIIDYHSTWGLAEYYVRLPWKLLIYFESSKIPIHQEGFPFQFEVIYL